jgi:hypothetical protein
MAVVYNFVIFPSIEQGVEEPEDTKKQTGAVAFVKATVSGAAGEAVNVARFGIKQLRGCIPGVVAAAIVTVNEAANTVTIPGTDGVYYFAVFGEREGNRQNFDVSLLK